MGKTTTAFETGFDFFQFDLHNNSSVPFFKQISF